MHVGVYVALVTVLSIYKNTYTVWEITW